MARLLIPVAVFLTACAFFASSLYPFFLSSHNEVADEIRESASYLSFVQDSQVQNDRGPTTVKTFPVTLLVNAAVRIDFAHRLDPTVERLALNYRLFIPLLSGWILLLLGSLCFVVMPVSSKVAATSSGLAVTALVGIGLLFLAKFVLGINSEGLLLVVFLAPILLYLIASGRVEGFNLLGNTVQFSRLQERLTDIDKNVTDLSGFENERGAYLGKLSQVSVKDVGSVQLLYADIDNLRSRAAEDYRKEGDRERQPIDALGAAVRRRTEKEIRGEIIAKLGFHLTDAFYEVAGTDTKAKYDLYFLEEPDIAMIVRNLSFSQIADIAGRAQSKLRTRNLCCTVALLGSVDIARIPSARSIDKTAVELLANGKQIEKGRVYRKVSAGSAEPVPVPSAG